MTGLDQDMMQKNLTCRNLKEAQWNMMSFSSVLVIVNLGFLALGALLYLYGHQQGILEESTSSGTFQLLVQDKGTGEMIARGTDYLFPILAIDYLPAWVGLLFILGLVAAAYSSADSALTALTTSFCIDFLRLDSTQTKAAEASRIRQRVQWGSAWSCSRPFVFFSNYRTQPSLLRYSRLRALPTALCLGFMALACSPEETSGMEGVLWVCLAAASTSFLLNQMAPTWFGITIGFEILLYNGGLTFLGLWLISRKSDLETA